MTDVEQVHERIAAYIAAHPEESYKSIAEKVGCATTTICNIAVQHGLRRRRPSLSLRDLAKLEGTDDKTV